MDAAPLDILVLADFHIGRGGGIAAPLLFRKALHHARHAGLTPGLVLLLGDLVEDGTHPDAEKFLVELADELRRTGLPWLAVPGNHDGDPERFCRIFETRPGLHEVQGYGFLVFHDQDAGGNCAARSAESLSFAGRVAAAHPGLLLIALQHHLIYPEVASDYPYRLKNADAVMAGYRAAGIRLSLSGHYHPGAAGRMCGGVHYETLPAVCDPPFRFAGIRITPGRMDVLPMSLQVSMPGLTDIHCHTQYAYCGKNVTVDDVVNVGAALGVACQCLTEHTFQLYFEKDIAWSWRWQTEPDLVRQAYAAGRGRMPEYRQLIQSYRSSRVRIGLEIDLCMDGRLLLADEDREGWDVFIGAIHTVPGFVAKGATQAEAERRFMREVERMVAHPIHVLAHPFRFFRRAGLALPVHLYGEVAGLLAAHGVAAEINFHTNTPDPAFVAACVARGVKIALASDSHDVVEIGEFAPHLDVLRKAGVRDSDFAAVLFSLPAAGAR
jgi:histidinol phosphatase-like PHP family hydrolase/predicted phosphodiesterase